MKISAILIGIIFLNPAVKAQAPKCIPATTEINLQIEGDANYLRVSPDGRFVLVTLDSKNVVLFEIKQVNGRMVAKKYSTPLKAEAYPTPNWEFIASPYHDDKTKFFRVDEILAKQKLATSRLDDSFSEFYNSVGGDPQNFRMVAWTFLSSRRYKSSQGGLTMASDIEVICPNLRNISKEEQLIARWYVRRSAFLKQTFERVAKIVNAKLKKDPDYAKNCDPTPPTLKRIELKATIEVCEQTYKKEFSGYVRAHRAELRITEEDTRNTAWMENHYMPDEFTKSEAILLNPMISPNGKEIAGVYKGTTRLYTLQDDLTCKESENLGLRTSKISFSAAGPDGKSRYVAFNDFYFDDKKNSLLTGTFIHDRITEKLVLLSDERSSYPNFTSDGRVYFIKRGKTLVIADPYQVTKGQVYSECVKAAVPTTQAQPPAKPKAVQK